MIAPMIAGAQKPVKIWGSAGLRAPVAKRLYMDINRQYGYKTGPVDLSFVQNTLGLQYYWGKHVSLSSGYVISGAPRKDKPGKRKNRWYATIGWRAKKGIWRYSGSLKYEKHGPAEKRYSARVIYGFYLRPSSNLISRKTKLTPFFSAQLFQNIGGKPISQYDREGNKTGKFAPEGLHRGRVKAGIYFKPAKYMKITLFGMFQKEFNTIWSEKNNRNINVKSPKSGKTYRRFNDYFVAGLSAKFYLPYHNKK